MSTYRTQEKAIFGPAQVSAGKQLSQRNGRLPKDMPKIGPKTIRLASSLAHSHRKDNKMSLLTSSQQ